MTTGHESSRRPRSLEAAQSLEPRSRGTACRLRSGSISLGAPCAQRERAHAERFFKRWGALAVLVSRPVPIIAETIGILAGTTPMGWSRFLLSVLLGNLPPAILYAFAGASAKNASYSVAIFLILVGLAGAWWLLGRRTDGLNAKDAKGAKK